MTHSSILVARDAPGTGERSLERIPPLLLELEEALRAMSAATQDAAHTVIPPGRGHESPAERYARAAESWPLRGGGAPPTHERQAELLSAFADARASLRAAAECCGRARSILASTLPASGGRPADLHP